jgi:hypothetical protein
VVLLVVVILPLPLVIAHGQSSQAVIRNPVMMSYGGMWPLIQEYEDSAVPDDLGSRFDGYEFSVGVGVDEHGHIGCGYQPTLRRPMQKASHVSENLLRRLAAPVCSSMATWTFRPFLLNGRPKAFMGPIVVNIERQKFVLAYIDAYWQDNPPPVKRK